MKINFLSVFYPYRGGISQFSANLFKAMEETADMGAFNFSRQYPGFLFPGKTQYVTPQDKALKIESRRLLDSINPFSWRRTAKEMCRHEPNAIILTYWMSFFAPALHAIAGYARRRGIRTVTVVHNAIPHEPKPWDKPFARMFFRRSDAFVSMCDAVSDDIRSLRPGAEIMQRPHPLYDHFGQKLERGQAAAELGVDPQKKTLLFFGLIRDYKGLDILVDAMRLLDDSYHLVVAGECYGSFEKYERQIEAAGLGGRIKVFNRYIDDAEVPTFFSAADLCVLPYRSATQSGITAISTHFDLPVVATRVGGLAESIERPGIGIMADDITPEAVAAAVEKYFAGEPDSFKANIAKLKSEMTWEGFARELVQFCEGRK